MRRALVLGATGHIGAHIVRALLSEGHSVRAAYRSQRFLHVLEGLPVERVRLDLDRPEGLPEALKGCDWVFHAAGYYPSRMEERRRAIGKGVESTRRLLKEMANARPERIVFTSSAATFQEAEGAGRSLYATVKVAMEEEALRLAREGCPVVIINPSLCIGEYDAHAFSGRALLAFAKHRIPWTVEAMLNVVYTGDVGVGHLRTAQRGRLGERYLLTGRNLSLREFGTWVAQAAGTAPPRWRLPHGLALAAGWGAELVARLTRTEPLFTRHDVRRARRSHRLDGSQALQELGVPQTPVEEAIRRALGWFRENGYL